MQYAKHGDRYVVRLDDGEEVMETMRSFLAKRDIWAGYFLAWGGFSELTLKYYRVNERDYKERRIEAQVEVVSLLGNIARLDGEPIIHAHTTVGDEEYRTYSGHLGEGRVRPLMEVFVTPFSGELRRVHDEERNLSVLDLGVGQEPVQPASGVRSQGEGSWAGDRRGGGRRPGAPPLKLRGAARSGK
ncbi:MAG: DNA-binding protein [Chloroflexota bacterium]|nr:DNA-binding protein [Chloroflexota bacterium]